jgi:chemotaxis signal transduction protein
LIRFEIGGVDSAIDVLEAAEIIRAGTSPRDTLTIRGRKVIIIDGAHLLTERPAVWTDSSRIIVLEGRGPAVGLLVDSVSELTRLDQIRISPAADPRGGIIQGICTVDQRGIALLDAAAIRRKVCGTNRSRPGRNQL